MLKIKFIERIKLNIIGDIVQNFKGDNLNIRFHRDGIIFGSQYISFKETKIIRDYLWAVFGKIPFK